MSNKNIIPITKGKKKKKSLMEKTFDAIIDFDYKKMATNVAVDVIVPSLYRVVTDSIDLMFHREPRRDRYYDRNARVTPYISYNDYSSRRNLDSNRRIEESVNRVLTGDEYEVTLSSRKEASDVLTRMFEIADSYEGIVSVSEYYQLVNVRHSFTDERYGWTENLLRRARIIQVSDGWIIKLPRAIAI